MHYDYYRIIIMSSLMRLADVRRHEPGTGERKRAVKRYLADHEDIRNRVAARANVDVTMVSKVLHGTGTSEKAEKALVAEETKDLKKAA